MITIQSLLSLSTYQQFYEKGLQVAESIGLPVSSWRVGDPTRSLYAYLAEILTTLEPTVQSYVASGFLDFASGDWLTILAKQVYGIDRDEATFATGDLVLYNDGAGQHDIEPGDLTFRSTVTEKTYHNTTGGTLNPVIGATLTLTWEADDSGSDYTVAADEIDELVTGLLEVSIQSSTAGIANDAQTDESLRTECRESIGALSPNGPADAYSYVAKNAELTGVTDVTKTAVAGNSTTGDVTLYLAGSAGPVAGGSVTAVSDAIATWATPLCITPTVVNATAVPTTIVMTVYVYDSVNATESEVQDAVLAKITAMFAALDIGGDDGALDPSKIGATAFAAFPTYVYRADVTTPAAPVALDVNETATISGTPTINVVFTEAP